MDDDSDPVGNDDWLRDLPLRSEEIGFTPDQMVACQACRRANAPNRSACMYCGAGLAGVAAEKKIDIRRLENWEDGINAIVTNPNPADPDSASEELASLTAAAASTLNPTITT